MLSKSVRLAAGQRVRLPSGLSPLVSLCVRLVSLLFPFVSLLVSLLVGHCVRLVTLHFLSLSLVLSPFLFPLFLFVGHCVRLVFVCLLVSLHCVRMSPFCLPLSPVLSPFCLPLSPVLSSLFPFVSLLVGHCALCFFLFLVLSLLLLVTVSVLSPFCFLLSPFLLVIVSALSPFFSPFVSGLFSLVVGHCVRFVSLLFPFVSLLVPLLVGHCVRLVFLLSCTCASSLPLCPAILYICLPALGCVSLAILYICLPVFTFVSQLWTAVAASALQSFVSQLWTSQALVAECSGFENHKLFGVYGGVTFCIVELVWLTVVGDWVILGGQDPASDFVRTLENGT